MAQLEHSLTDICAKHDLTAISVGVNLKQSEASRFGVTLHWDGYSVRGIPCQSGHGADVPEALAAALERARTERTPPAGTDAIADEPLSVAA